MRPSLHRMLRQRLASLGITLPAATKPVAAYVPARRHGDLVYVSGQLPLLDGALVLSRALGPESDLEAARGAMARCFLNGLAAAALAADLDEITGVLRLGAFVASRPEFTDQHKVANGASELAQQIFGDAGVHVRAAVGVPSLPLGAAVELEILFTLKGA